jgi:hypothetical protein
MKPDSYLPPFFAVDLLIVTQLVYDICITRMKCKYVYCIDVKFLLQNVNITTT